jgi:hypothetical protein
MYVTLSPAYGRDYRSRKAVQADWDAEKDFTIESINHPYCGRKINKQQTIGDGHRYVVRYAHLTKQAEMK